MKRVSPWKSTPRVTSDKHVFNRTSMCVRDVDGLIHYSVNVEDMPQLVRDAHDGLSTPFLVKMCDLFDAYDAASSWLNFKYPSHQFLVDLEFEGVPTCIRCSSA